MAARTTPLARERTLILIILLALAAGSWAWLAWQAAALDMGGMGATMGVAPPLFLAMWTVMMVAMMFPTAAPYILTFHGVQVGKRQRGQAFVATWIFVAVYLVVWIAFGAVAYMLAVQAQTLAGAMRWPGDTVARIGGVLIILAGLYQLSPLKGLCLSKCRSPLSFILTSWRDGVGGAIRMGLQHASYCLGCCWLLFVILFPIGVMNIAAMVLITALIFAEKALPHGHRVAVLAAVGLVVYGIVVIAAPQALPTFMPGASMEDMPAPHALP